MGAPYRSRAIFTTSIARTTPAQKPRGLRRIIFFCEAAKELVPVAVVESDARPVKDIAEVSVYQAVTIGQRVASQWLLGNLNGFKFTRKRLACQFDKLHVYNPHSHVFHFKGTFLSCWTACTVVDRRLAACRRHSHGRFKEHRYAGHGHAFRL